MGALMRGRDWSGTPLGLPEGGDLAAEPAHLRQHLSELRVSHPAVVGAGTRDALQRRICSDDRGQASLRARTGRRGLCWPEIWDVIGPMLRQVLESGQPTRSRDLLLTLERKGFPEECYFSFYLQPDPRRNGRKSAACSRRSSKQRAR